MHCLKCYSTCANFQHLSNMPGAVKLTAFVALLRVTVSRLDGRAIAVAVDPVTRASALLNASSTGHRAVCPLGPGRPAVYTRITRLRKRIGEHIYTGTPNEFSEKMTYIMNNESLTAAGLTCSAARAAFAVWHSGVGTGHERA